MKYIIREVGNMKREVNARPILRHTYPELKLLIRREHSKRFLRKKKYYYIVFNEDTGISVMPPATKENKGCLGVGDIFNAIDIAKIWIGSYGEKWVLRTIENIKKMEELK